MSPEFRKKSKTALSFETQCKEFHMPKPQWDTCGGRSPSRGGLTASGVAARNAGGHTSTPSPVSTWIQKPGNSGVRRIAYTSTCGRRDSTLR
ncbi:hypothetical protein CDAR_618681 [Caerostris darwini]|uniref:Uncharacterized protein n=1 Tax=Caerostris darwini TaxID=1538125 RepID=A0AAV4WSM5_9ARAC|nr:hypothetical protein CDAR_618681 [Caerostris darwini]